MPAIKCSACGHRHFQPMPEYVNCGAPLAASPAMEQQSPNITAQESSPAINKDDVVAYERFLAETANNNNTSAHQRTPSARKEARTP